MLEQSRHPIDVIATETGFADRERMRRSFLRIRTTASSDSAKCWRRIHVTIAGYRAL
jgi:transcriptional regulator GlxA family with amidase domain